MPSFSGITMSASILRWAHPQLLRLVELLQAFLEHSGKLRLALESEGYGVIEPAAVIFTMSGRDEDFREVAMRLGAKRGFRKPVGRGDLLAEIPASHLSNSRQSGQPVTEACAGSRCSSGAALGFKQRGDIQVTAFPRHSKGGCPILCPRVDLGPVVQKPRGGGELTGKSSVA